MKQFAEVWYHLACNNVMFSAVIYPARSLDSLDIWDTLKLDNHCFKKFNQKLHAAVIQSFSFFVTKNILFHKKPEQSLQKTVWTKVIKQQITADHDKTFTKAKTDYSEIIKKKKIKQRSHTSRVLAGHDTTGAVYSLFMKSYGSCTRFSWTFSKFRS